MATRLNTMLTLGVIPQLIVCSVMDAKVHTSVKLRDLVDVKNLGCVDIVCKPKTRLTSIADYLRGALDIIYPPHI